MVGKRILPLLLNEWSTFHESRDGRAVKRNFISADIKEHVFRYFHPTQGPSATQGRQLVIESVKISKRGRKEEEAYI